MKKQLLFFAVLLSAALFNTHTASAQCTPTGEANPGIYVNGNYCMEQDSSITLVWQFQNYTTITIQGTTVMVDSISIDTIYNLPAGIDWLTSQRVYPAGAEGCLFFWGATGSPVGSYQLDIGVTAYIPGLTAYERFSSQEQALGAPPSVRVIAKDSICVAPDTLASDSENTGTSTPYSLSYTGINDFQPAINGIGNYPNPFSGNTEIVFGANGSQQVTFRVFDLLGNTIHEEQVTTAPGRNIVNFNANGMSSGIYFYSISSGKNTYSNKMVITE